MEKVLILSTFPSPYPQSCVALGQRWIAYPSNQSISNFNKPPPTASDKLVEVAKDMFMFGNCFIVIVLHIICAMTFISLGQKTLTEYMYSSDSGQASKNEITDPDHSGAAGTVSIHRKIGTNCF